jgi:hypothetical protein
MSNLSFVDTAGARHQIENFNADALFAEAKARSITPVQAFNLIHADADLAVGTAFQQAQASLGLINPKNPFGLKNLSMSALMGESGGMQANTQQNTSPFGTASRAFAIISVIDAIESAMTKDRETDAANFESIVANTVSLNSEHFEQPVVDYGTQGGPEQAKAQRVAQGATPPRMVFFKTADRIRRIGAWNIGMEWSHQALKATTLDYVTMTVSRFLQVERDQRVYNYINDLFNGNGDMITGAVSAVTSTSLDTAATGGVLTHKAWLKFLARNRKYRKISHVICDLDSYLKIEDRTGRPGSNNYDPTLARIDPQGVMKMPVGFGNDVQVILVDAATDGGPVPANTVYAVDARYAVSRVTNSLAAYNAVEDFALRRTTAMRMDWSEEVFRTFGDSDLRAFDVLTIS